LRADVFPHEVTRLELVETHISWVLLTGRYAYKIKRPVKLDFIDTSTLGRRRWLCEEELRLNRRLAPELYIDVVPIGRTALGLRIGNPENVVEYAVRMHQFDRSQELSALLSSRTVAVGEVRELARVISDFHARAPIAEPASGYGRYAELVRVVEANLCALESHARAHPEPVMPKSLFDWLRTALESQRTRLEARNASGFVRECHGDLHARNIVRWNERLLPFDCLEFNPAIRWIDTASEIAFLYMDFLGYGRPDLAYSFVSTYLEGGGDYHGLAVLRLFAVHLALVRAKVDALQSVSGHGDAGESARRRFAKRLSLAADISVHSKPTLFVMSGVSGSGKSWLSERMIPELGAVRVRSDLERKRLLGLPELAQTGSGPDTGIYAPAISARTYDRLLACAEEALLAGHPVIADATFLEASQRHRFLDLAERTGCPALIVRCTAAPSILRSRIRERESAGRDPSEANLAVLGEQLRRFEEPNARERAHTVLIDTAQIGLAGDVMARIRGAMAATPAG
jgi:aminoglycoside phosphotransferase family enzyme/predicted kinase